MFLMLETLIFNGSLQDSQDRYSDVFWSFWYQLQPFTIVFYRIFKGLKILHISTFYKNMKYFNITVDALFSAI